MAEKKVGAQTIKFKNSPYIQATASIVGKKEGEGPLKNYFDIIIKDDMFDEKTWEKAESKMNREAVKNALLNAKLENSNIDYMFGGDLLDQIISSSFSAREFRIHFFGLYGACSTMAEALCLGAISIDGGFADNVLAVTSSHFCAAERQFRFPLELGSQRPPTAQWTVTGSGAVILGNKQSEIGITYATIGRVMDFGIADANNMGAAMAPAAADTIMRHFKDTGLAPKDYDLIATGDLGKTGMELTKEIITQGGYMLENRYTDCGVEIFDLDNQDVHSGGSGCGCSATVFSGYIYKLMLQKKLNRVLLVSTGALLSPTSSMQGETIPGIAHAVTIERRR
jgi:stage V sporulation protein AD